MIGPQEKRAYKGGGGGGFQCCHRVLPLSQDSQLYYPVSSVEEKKSMRDHAEPGGIFTRGLPYPKRRKRKVTPETYVKRGARMT